MQARGRALMGTGVGTGKKRATEAAEMAICSPLLEDVSIEGATDPQSTSRAARTCRCTR